MAPQGEEESERDRQGGGQDEVETIHFSARFARDDGDNEQAKNVVEYGGYQDNPAGPSGTNTTGGQDFRGDDDARGHQGGRDEHRFDTRASPEEGQATCR